MIGEAEEGTPLGLRKSFCRILPYPTLSRILSPAARSEAERCRSSNGPDLPVLTRQDYLYAKINDRWAGDVLDVLGTHSS